MAFKFTCPKCHRQNPLSDDHSGNEVVCSGCGAKFKVKAPKKKDAPPAVAQPALPDPTPGAETVQAPEPQPVAQVPPASPEPVSTPEPEPQAAAPVPEPEPEPQAAAPVPEPEPEPQAAAPVPEPEPEPQAAAPVPEPEPQAEAPVPEPEPEPQAVAPAPEPEPEPEPQAAAPAPEPEPEPAAASGPADGIALLWGVGDVIADLYEVRALVRDDRFGQSYQVYHRGWKSDVIIHTPGPVLLESPDSRNVLSSEAGAWAALGLHPNVVGYFYTRVLGGVPRLLTEWTNDTPLKDWIVSRRLYDGDAPHVLEKILDVFIQAARGLQHAHAHGLTHGGVGTDTLVLDPERTTRVAHFGFSRALEEARRSSAKTDVPEGPRAPEQRAGQSASRATDVWLLGLTLAATLLGVEAWPDDPTPAPDKVRAALQNGSEVVDNLPEPVLGFVQRCLHADPGGRYPGMQEVAEALKTVYSETCGGAYPRLEVADLDPADAVNNKGVAEWDLGHNDAAQELFEEAMGINHECYAALYNQGLMLWRADKLSFNGMLNQLEMLPNGWQRTQFRAQVAAEQGDRRCTQWLADALEEAPPGSRDAQQLRHVQSLVEAGESVTAPAALCSALQPARVEAPPGGSPAQEYEDLLNQGRAAVAAGDWARAAEALSHARLGPVVARNPSLADYLGVVARHQGRGALGEVRVGRRLEGHTDAVNDLAVTLDGDMCVSAGADKTIRVWDLSTGICTRTLTGHEDAILNIAITPDGATAATVSSDRSVRTWDVANGKALKTFQGHEDEVMGIAITGDGRVIVTGSRDKTVRVWNGSTGRCSQVLEGHTDGVLTVAVSSDGRLAASAGSDRSVRVWDLATGSCLHTLDGHTEAVWSVALTADGRFLASASEDCTVRMWDLEQAACLQVLTGHADSIARVEMTPDARYVVSGGFDHTVRLWDARTGHCLQSLGGHRDVVHSVALTLDARRIVSASADHSMRLWELQWNVVPQVEQEWDEQARPLLFALLQTRLRRKAGRRTAVSLEEFERLLDDLANCGYGWLHATGVKAQVEKILGVTVLWWEPSDARRAVLEQEKALFAAPLAPLEVPEEEPPVAPAGESGADATVHLILPDAAVAPVRTPDAPRRPRFGPLPTPAVAEPEPVAAEPVPEVVPTEPPPVPVEPAVAAVELAPPPAEPALASPVPAAVEVPDLIPVPALAATVPAPVELLPPLAEPALPPPLPTAPDSNLLLAPVTSAPSMGAVDLHLEAPLLPPILDQLAPDLNAPILLGPDGEADMSLPPLGMPPLPGPLLMAPQPPAPPVAAEPQAPTAHESGGGKKGKKGKDKGRDKSRPSGSLATEEELSPVADAAKENGVATPLADTDVAATSAAEPPSTDKPVELSSSQDEQVSAPPASTEPSHPEPDLARPAISPVPMPSHPSEEFIGPIRRAELAAAAKRAQEIAQVAKAQPKPDAPVVAPVVEVKPAEPVPELEPEPELLDLSETGPEDDEPSTFFEEPANETQGGGRAQRKKTFYKTAELLLKVSKPEAPTPALAGPAEPSVPLKRPVHEDVWEVGDRLLDLYQVTQFLGEGTMGKVYKVLHPRWNIELAMRTPRAAIHGDKGVLGRWLHEAQRWAELGVHPHVVSCYYARTAHSVPRIFMEHVESGTLSTWIHSGKLYAGGKDLAIHRILDVAIQVARGISYAHERQLIHQDVKPGNVLMTCDGTAKVSDFGLGRAWEGTLDEDRLPPGRELLTNIGGLTPAYASPEQVQKQALTHHTDIWSWALMVLEMFTGEVIWTSGRQASKGLSDYMLYGAENADIPTMPEGVSQLLEQCFKEKPADRPDSLRDIGDRLEKLYQNLSGEEYPRTVVGPDVLKAATLNNRALAARDLGHLEQSDRLFDQALKADPQSLHAVFNGGLTLLRTGRMTFEALRETLTTHVHAAPGNDWEVPYLEAWLHIERGEEEEASRLLIEAHREAFNDPDGEEATNRASGLSRAYNSNLSVLTAHGSPAWGVDITNDAAFAISASDDSTLRVWDVSTGRCLRVLEGHTAAVFSVSLSAEGHVALSGGEDMTLRVWNVGIGEAVHELEGHTDSVTGVVVTNTRTGASCSLDGTLRTWDLENGYCTRTFKDDNTPPLTALAASADMQWLLAAEEGGDVVVWSVATQSKVRTLKGHSEKVGCLAMTPDAKVAISASDDGTLRIWDVETGTARHVLEGHHGWVNGVAMNNDGTLAISAGWDKTLRVWEISTGRCLYTLTGHENHVRAVALTPDGKQAVSVTIDGAMGFWKLPEELAEAPWMVVRARASGHRSKDRDTFVESVEKADTLAREEKWQEGIQALNEARDLPGYEWSPVGVSLTEALALHGGRGSLRGVWTSNILEARHRTMRALAVSANARLAVTGNGNGQVQAWDLAAARPVRNIDAHDKGVHAVALSHDGITAFSAGADDIINVWNLPRAECLVSLRGHAAGVWDVDCSPDGQWVVSGSWDETVRVWSIAERKCIKTLKGHDGPVLTVALSPDGRYVASGSSDNTVKVWEVSSGRCLRTLEGHDDVIGTVTFIGVGATLLSGSNDRTLRLWDLETGKSMATLQGHRGPINAAAVSPDGQLVVSGSYDWTVRVWRLPDANNKQPICLRSLDGHLGSVRGVALHHDGRHGLTISEDGTMRQWLFDWSLEPKQPAEWDPGALVFLANFLAPARGGGPGKTFKWSLDEFDDLMHTLAQNGYGWLSRNGVETELNRQAAILAESQRGKRATAKLPGVVD